MCTPVKLPGKSWRLDLAFGGMETCQDPVDHSDRWLLRMDLAILQTTAAAVQVPKDEGSRSLQLSLYIVYFPN